MLRFAKTTFSSRQRLSQAGDTMVEVLIAIGIVGLMLTSAYAITNRSNRGLQDAQERGQALKLVESQIEMMRNHGSLPTGAVCFKSYSSGQPGTTPADCALNSSGAKATGGQTTYNMSIVYTGGVYVVKAQWDSVLTGQANVTVYYRF